MARKRTELSADVEARIEALMRSGGTAEGIASQLRAEGVALSRATIGRRLRELRGPVATRATTKVAPPSAPDSEPPLPTSPEDIPSDASLPELADLLRRAKVLLAEAEAAKNLPLAGQMIRVCSQLAETIRKATPPERPDPNDSPDMVALGKQVAERLHKMVDLVAKGDV